MLFNSAAYLIFLPVVVVLFWLTPFRFRTALLLLASYIFYMFWKPAYGLLIFGLTLVNYFLGLAMERFESRKRSLLVGGIALNLVVLGFFKYAYFTRDVANSLMKGIGQGEFPAIPFEIILPLGISFFVFEFIHYLCEVHKGNKAVRSFPEFALFAAFFPTQIAGPIKRYQDFLPQLKVPQKITLNDFNEGIELIIFGLFKKVVVADSIALVVNRCYAHPDLLTGADFWLATWCFAFQVYFDFSGYTDIARGSAQLLGFKVPLNFHVPYISSSISEFWKRWHISLSVWLRDYLYFPLGGSRGGELAACRNMMITMTLAGLWHGAAAHFVVWGFYLGLMLVVHRFWQLVVARHDMLANLVKTKPFHWFAIALTFNAFAAGLVFFRSENMGMAWMILKKMFLLAPAPGGLPLWEPSILNSSGSFIFPILPVVLAGIWIAQVVCARFKGTPGIMPEPRWLPGFKPVYLAVLIALLLVLSPDVTPSFVYFQF